MLDKISDSVSQATEVMDSVNPEAVKDFVEARLIIRSLRGVINTKNLHNVHERIVGYSAIDIDYKAIQKMLDIPYSIEELVNFSVVIAEESANRLVNPEVGFSKETSELIINLKELLEGLNDDLFSKHREINGFRFLNKYPQYLLNPDQIQQDDLLSDVFNNKYFASLTMRRLTEMQETGSKVMFFAVATAGLLEAAVFKAIAKKNGINNIVINPLFVPPVQLPEFYRSQNVEFVFNRLPLTDTIVIPFDDSLFGHGYTRNLLDRAYQIYTRPE